MKKGKKFITAVAVVLVTVILAGAVYVNDKLDKLTYDRDGRVESADTEVTENVNTFENNIFNILLLGTDERTAEFSDNARADAIMLLSLNLKEGTAVLASLERGVGVPIEGRNIDLLTHTFRYGGAEGTLKAVRDNFGVDVYRYARANFAMFEQIIDAIGGVDIELTEAECKALNGEVRTNSTTRNKVYPGINHLDGYDAVAYARQRFIDDDWHRVVRQRNVVQAVVDKTKHMGITEINSAIDKILPLVMTNLEKKEMANLIFHAPKFIGVDIQQLTIPVDGTYWSRTGVDGRKYIGVDFEANAKILQDLIYGTEE